MWINQVLQKNDDFQPPFFATIVRVNETTIDIISPFGEIFGVFIIKPINNNAISLKIGQQVLICSCIGGKYCCIGTTIRNVDLSIDCGGGL